MQSCHHLVKIIPHNKVLSMWTLWFCTFLWIHAYGVCVKQHSSRAKPSVYLLWCACFLVWLLADCHHRGSLVEGDTRVWLITVLSVSCFHSIFLAFLSLLLSLCVLLPLCSQRTWMTCGWRVWQGWFYPAVSSAKDAAPISLNHRPKLHSTSALGVPGKCFYLLSSGTVDGELTHSSAQKFEMSLFLPL